jgi:predicted RNA-binding Zn-ribbon protein involved in translation (DUF1610 family)
MPLFYCEKCDYTTSVKCNYTKHLETEKHLSPKSINVVKNVVFHVQPAAPAPTAAIAPAPSSTIAIAEPNFECPECGKQYAAQRSLWRHSKRCRQHLTIQESHVKYDNSIYDKFTTTVSELCKSNAELSKMNQLQQSQIHEMFNYFVGSLQQLQQQPQQPHNYVVATAHVGQSATTGAAATASPATNGQTNITNNLHCVNVNGNMTSNSNNKTVNINMFLNEECKDAMNMSDFVKTIELDTDDMEDVGKYGFVKGISKIFIDNLEKTEITKRPIHCSDARREILYIKDDDKWQREGIHSKKLVNAIHTVEHKNVVLVNEWAKMNPQCENSETTANQIYMTLSKHAHDGDDVNITKVAKRIAKTVTIDKTPE